jgi:predicted secreted protein
MMDPDNVFQDERSRKIALVAHCIMNQNSRATGLSKRPSIITEIVEFLVHNEIGVIQMPCPELPYAGLVRPPQTRDQYDNVVFRRCCRKIAEELANQVHEYETCGIKLKLVIGIDGSPSCGVNETSKENTRKNKPGHKRVKGSGILIEELCSALSERRISVPFYGIRYERLKNDADKLEKLIKPE